VAEGEWNRWGPLWEAHWWTAETTAPAPGTYTLSTLDTDGRTWSQPIEVGRRPYFERSFEHVGLGQFERRSKIPTAPGHGWIDCGAHLSEANSHAGALFGMVEFLRERSDALTTSDRARLLAQIRIGADYFLFLADEAQRRGMPPGTYQHEPVGPSTWLVQDSLQAGVALCRAIPVFRQAGDSAFAARLLDTVQASYAFVRRDPETVMREMLAQLPVFAPQEDIHLRTFSRHTHALDEEIAPPVEWTTQELRLLLQFQLDLDPLVDEDLSQEQFGSVEAILERWRGGTGTDGPTGWFVPFAGVDQPEVAWTHHSVGRDTGGVFPHDVLPLLTFAQRHSGHPLAARSRACVEDFVQRYLAPARTANPFGLLPRTWKAGEGWLHFAGLWHGMNASYALMAMQCFQLARALDKPWLADFGRAQLDWIAGLNCGLTDASQSGCIMTHRDVPADAALPVSLIWGVGRDWAGSWRTIRGSICNGFSRGKQFMFDAEPTVAQDRPDALTDEDWISHAGAWLAALAHSDL